MIIVTIFPEHSTFPRKIASQAKNIAPKKLLEGQIEDKFVLIPIPVWSLYKQKGLKYLIKNIIFFSQKLLRNIDKLYSKEAN